jgi:hypothetical protein
MKGAMQNCWAVRNQSDAYPILNVARGSRSWYFFVTKILVFGRKYLGFFSAELVVRLQPK